MEATLADVTGEAEAARSAARGIEQIADDEGLAIHFRGMSELPLAILFELRDIKEELVTVRASMPDA
jgi:hypothetical protein